MNEPASFCRSPCNNPDQQARDRGLPPAPPPPRDPPREIPGFPSGGHKADAIEIAVDVSVEQEVLGRLNARTSDEQVHLDTDHKGEDLLKPPYRIDNHAGSGDLSDLTMDTNLRHDNGLWTYDTHNLYGMRK